MVHSSDLLVTHVFRALNWKCLEVAIHSQRSVLFIFKMQHVGSLAHFHVLISNPLDSSRCVSEGLVGMALVHRSFCWIFWWRPFHVLFCLRRCITRLSNRCAALILWILSADYRAYPSIIMLPCSDMCNFLLGMQTQYFCSEQISTRSQRNS